MTLLFFCQTQEKAEFFEISTQEILVYLQVMSQKLLHVFSLFLPFLFSVAVATINISLISGLLIYLLDYNEENGKRMILRSLVTLILVTSIFNLNPSDFQPTFESAELMQQLVSFITSYLLFIFAAISLMLFIGNSGLYLIDSDPSRKKNLKKSGLCLLCVIIPLGFQFPYMPLWIE